MKSAIPVLAGYHRKDVTLNGTSARAYYRAAGDGGLIGPVIPQTDLLRLVEALGGHRLIFSPGKVTLVSSDWETIINIPAVFIEGVGLKCFDLRQVQLPFSEEQQLAA